MKTLNRREFLDFAKNLIGSLFLFITCPFLNTSVQAGNIFMPDKTNLSKILVIYSSLHGSTKQIAEFISGKLRKTGITAEVASIRENIDFSLYEGVIMGAPIHRGKWMEEAVDFVNNHRNDLMTLHFACFYTCMSKAKHPPTVESLKELSSYQNSMTELFPELPSSNIGIFAGALYYDKCSFLIKLVLWFIMRKNNLEEGDYRDWQAIESWVSSVGWCAAPTNKF